jgi:dipeptidyl aminopeptidase/acylaminoacyl peptidase
MRSRFGPAHRAATLAAAAAVIAAGGLHAQRAPLYTVDDWLTVSSVRSFTWAPDGDRLYYTSDAASSGTVEIFRVGLDGGEPVQLSGNPEGVRPEPKEDMVLSADGETLFFTSARYFQRMYNIFRMPASGGEAVQLTFHDGIIETDPQPSPDGSTLAYFTRTGRGTKIFLLDLTAERAWPRLFDAGSETDRNPSWSPDGRHLAFSRRGNTWVRAVEGGEARPLIGPEYTGSHGSAVWSPDGGRIAFTTGASGYSQVGVVDVETGRVTSITYDRRDHGGIGWSPDGRWLVFTRSDGAGMARELVVALADGSGSPAVLVDGPAVRSSPRFSPDGAWIAFLETAGNRTADIWLVPAEGGTPRQVTHSMGRVNPEHLSVPEEITYPGPDNLQIPALLYRPPDYDPSRLHPVIVALHGHPSQWNHALTGRSIPWQYFIQRGFLVVAPNPRGSVGFGRGFHDLHVGGRGGTEHEDVMNVLDYLKRLRYVDMTRKATWGGSGGGYASFVIATHAPAVYSPHTPTAVEETFQAQIIRAPVSSRKEHVIDRFVSPARMATPTREPGQILTAEMGGTYHEFPERYDLQSPLNYVERVQIPQLLMHGLRDGSVLHNESRRWVLRMHELGKADLIEYVEYPDEDHSLNRYRETRREKLGRVERFLAEHLNLPRLAGGGYAVEPLAAATGARTEPEEES